MGVSRAPSERSPGLAWRSVFGWAAGVFGAAAAVWLTGLGDSLWKQIDPSAKPVEATEVRYFRTQNVLTDAPILRIVKRTSGVCGDWSLADPGGVPEARRCFADHTEAYDPCFEAGYEGEQGSAVECVEAPWSGTSVRLLVLHELQQPNGRKPSARRKNDVSLWPPWAVNLTNGDRCLLATGLEPHVAGLPLTYRCRNGVAFGLPDRGHKLWTIYYKRAQDTGSVTVSIATAWY
jgi:hypothetical protein